MSFHTPVKSGKSFLISSIKYNSATRLRQNESFFLHIDPGSNLDYVLQVPFTEVLDLVSKRKVYLEDGFAYVSRDDMISIVMTYYRSHLSHSLAVGLLDLVSKSKVYLEDGFAYVSRDDILQESFVTLSSGRFTRSC